MRRCYVLSALLLATLSAPVSAEVLRFDCGSEKSELREGFTRIAPSSVYRKDIGYGWRSSEGLKSHHQHYSRDWDFNESRGSTQPPPIYTNEITCDSIYSSRANSFLIDVPPGEYAVYLLAGRSSGRAQDYYDFEVSAGSDRASLQIPGPYIFEKRLLKASPERGQIAIDFAPKTEWLLAALLVFPIAEQAKVQAEVIDPLEKEIYFLPPDVAAQWKETRHVDDRPLPDFSPRDRERGYAIFARHWSEVVYPNTVPRQEELNPELRAFASPGEYEPVTFTVHPLKDLRGVRVTASDLRCDDATIPAENLDIRCVRYMLVRPNYSTYFSYHVAPDVLERREQSDIPLGNNQRYWITAKIPEDARPGVYEGKLAVTASGAPAAEVSVKLRVLPIKLQTNPEHVYGMYYRDPLSLVSSSNRPEANAYLERKAELERQDMVEHGMNCHISSVSGLSRDPQGNWTIDGEETERRIALDRKYGLAGKPLVVSFPVSHWYAVLVDKRGLGSHLRLVRPDVPASFFDEVTKMVEVIEKERKSRSWPEFLYYPIDEPSTQADSVAFMVNVLRAIKKVPGVRTYVTADPSHEQFEPMWPHVDVWCCQPFVFGCEKIERLSKEKQIEFWCYPNHISGENDHTPVRGARMTWGYGFWKSGFKALIPWIYQSSGGDPWNYLDSSSMDFFNRSTPQGEPIPVTLWEAYREGIDDGRYLYTLQQLIEKARKQGGRAAGTAEDAQREVQRLWDSIDVQEKYKHDGLWDGRDFDARRWVLASEIIKLQDAMAGVKADSP